MTSESPHDAPWLREARASYLESAGRKIDDLTQAVSALELSPSDPIARQNLHVLLHNLVGSGASYGFPSISVIARRMSSTLKRVTDERMVRESGLAEILRSGIEELRAAFESARKNS